MYPEYFHKQFFFSNISHLNIVVNEILFCRLTESNLNAEGSSYLSPCANNKAAINNLVHNVPPKNANGKNANSSSDNKPIQKVKKTYI